MAGLEHAVLAKQRTADVVWRIRSVGHVDPETAPGASVVFHVLQVPEVNVRLAGLEVDFLWRAERLVVEVDGWRHHSGRAKWEHDRWRDQRLMALGLRVMRVTWRQLTGTPVAVAVRLTQAVATGLGASPAGVRRAT